MLQSIENWIVFRIYLNSRGFNVNVPIHTRNQRSEMYIFFRDLSIGPFVFGLEQMVCCWALCETSERRNRDPATRWGFFECSSGKNLEWGSLSLSLAGLLLRAKCLERNSL